MTSPDIAAASRPLPGWRVEFGRNWPIVLGCLLGLAAGVLSLPFIMVTFFIKDWESEFGWARGSIALAPVCLFSALAIAAPFAGWLSDRIAAVWLVGVSLVGVALGMYLNSTLTGRLWELLALMTFLGLIGAGSSSLVFSRIINANFSDARGTALGIALIGNGLSQGIAPALLAPYVADHGWRQGVVALSLVGLIGTPIVISLLRNAQRGVQQAETAVPADGMSFGDAVRSRVFWIMAIAFFLTMLPATGLLGNFITLLRDQHATPSQLGLYGGLMGLFLIVGRLLAGWLFDRAFAPFVAAAMMLICAVGFLVLAEWGLPVAALGALSIGLSYGAEVDMAGYLTARYFGMRAFGRCYGVLYTFVLIGAIAGPWSFAILYDVTKSYNVALLGGGGLFFTGSMLLLTLPRFSPTPLPTQQPAIR